MRQTIDLRVADAGEQGDPTTFEAVLPAVSEYPMNFNFACDVLKVGSRSTRSAYRQYLGLEVGETLDKPAFNRFALMVAFCRKGSGKAFSRPRFVQIEADVCRGIEGLAAVQALASYMAEVFSVYPYDLELLNTTSDARGCDES